MKREKKNKRKLINIRSSSRHSIIQMPLFVSSQCPKFPEFGKEVRRSFAVSHLCYDCVRFIDGCKGWKATKKFECPKVKWYKKVKAG
jgi:hypothetical protein